MEINRARIIGLFLGSLMVLSVGIGSASAEGAAKNGYVTSAITLPATISEAKTFARDVDGRGSRDNAFGRFWASVANLGIDLQTPLSSAIEQGDLLMLHALRTRSFSSDRNASWQVLYADPTPDPDFSGGGSFAVSGTAPHSLKLPAKIKNLRVQSGAGPIPVRLDFGVGVFMLNLRAGKVSANCTRRQCSAGRINGAFPAAQIDQRLIPELAAIFGALLVRDCPGPDPPSCMAGSQGKSIQQVFDLNDDLAIPADELRENQLVQDDLAPDLDLVRANGKPGRDGKKDSVSMGLAFSAVHARLTQP